MVSGMESFRDHFKDYLDCYTVIGGAACEILMRDADLQFRITKDIDMILILEDRYKEFAQIFWEYIKEGGYRCGWRNNEEVHFYRFTEPKQGYPSMIELFSRRPDYHLTTETGIVPIHISDELSSLSAILLNDDFYQFMMEGRKTINGISILDAPYLIPFKMYAWIDLTDKRAIGQHVNEKDLKKHKYDVFRLLEIIPDNVSVKVSGKVADSVRVFMERIRDEALPLSQIGLGIDKSQAIEALNKIYRYEQ